MHDGGPSFLLDELKYINWSGYPTSPFPDSFQPVKLVVMKLESSRQKELWMGYKHLPHLKVLQLRSMENLLSTPDFRGLPCLQKFILDGCWELEEIHPSLGNHSSLEYIKVSGCPRLPMFPTIVQMEKLKTLIIESCYVISEFPKIQANMESLVKLSLHDMKIKVLPSSIGERCTNLISLEVIDCSELKSIEFNLDALIHLSEFKLSRYYNRMMSGLTLHHFPRSLRKLDLSDFDFRDGEIPSDIGELSILQELDLSGNKFTRIDFSLSQLTQLKFLHLYGCESLVELPKLPSSLAILTVNRCKSLTTVGDCHKDCKRLCQVSLTGGSIVIDGGRLLESMLQGNAIEDHSMLLLLEGLEIPKEFIPHLCYGSRRTLQLPNNWRDDFCGFLMCAVVSNYVIEINAPVEISMKQAMSEGMDSPQNDVVWKEGMGDTSTWVGYISFGSLRHTSWWDHTINTLSFSILGWDCGGMESEEYNGFGVRLVSRNSRDGPRETLTDSSELSDYKPNFEILHDSASALTISLGEWDPWAHLGSP